MMDSLFDIAPLRWPAVLCAMISGTIIGFERQLLGKPVGIRTSILICLGSYTFVTVSNSVADESTGPSRIIGQVVTGIGFLGAGVMLARDGLVVGVTSAAAIWILAAIGVTIASMYYWTGVKIAILGVVILVGIDMLEHTFAALQKGVHAKLISKLRK